LIEKCMNEIRKLDENEIKRFTDILIKLIENKKLTIHQDNNKEYEYNQISTFKIKCFTFDTDIVTCLLVYLMVILGASFMIIIELILTLVGGLYLILMSVFLNPGCPSLFVCPT